VEELTELFSATAVLEKDLCRQDPEAEPSIQIRLFSDGTGSIHELTCDETIFEFASTAQAIAFCKAGSVRRLVMAQERV